ncbi:MAG: hypothetical protein IJ654_09165 [Bacteroidales bacterium]|nr:hypothetical protein [Bacteroidales bacterium]
MKKTLILLSLTLMTVLVSVSCNKKNKDTDPLRSTTWSAYDGDNLMVLKFELGTIATFYIGNNNLDRVGNASMSSYTLTDNTRISFADLNGSYENERYRFKTGTLDGDSMVILYDRWTSAGGLDGEKTHTQAVFRKKVDAKKK